MEVKMSTTVDMTEVEPKIEARNASIGRIANQAIFDMKPEMAQNSKTVVTSRPEEGASEHPANQGCSEAEANFNGVNLLKDGYLL